MAWIDNRAWCHDKVAGISDAAFRVWVSSICYSSGFLLEGTLSAGHLRVIGSTPKIRRELEDAGLWIDDGPRIIINDWDEHNGARDKKERERRIRDAQRKREQRKHVSEAEWASARRRVFERDNGVCADCGTYDEKWHADHVPEREVLIERGIRIDDIAYIQTRCASCHGRRTGHVRAAREKADGKADIHADGAPVTVEEVKSDSKEQNQKLLSNENVAELLTTTRLRSVS